MSKGTEKYIAQRKAEAEAAQIIGEAIAKAREILTAAEVDDSDDVVQSILDADAE